LLTGRKPNHIARPDFLDRAGPTLRPPKAGRDDQRLTEWMCMPGGAGTRLERDACATNTCGLRRLEQRINSYGTRKPIRRTFAGILRTRSFYLHLLNVALPSLLSTLNLLEIHSSPVVSRKEEPSTLNFFGACHRSPRRVATILSVSLRDA